MDYSTFYKDYIFHYWEDDKGLRVGQFFMNELAEYNFELYKSVPPELDCFYDDTLFCYCSDWVGENWKDTVNTDKTTEEPKMPITKPEFYDNLPPGDKTLYRVAEKEVSKQWAKALTNFIDELGGDWDWKGLISTPEEVIECLREHIQYLQQLAADDELEACVEWASIELNCTDQEHLVPYLREYRRPKPTLKSQALKDFETVRKHSDLLPEILDTIENALKSIPE